MTHRKTGAFAPGMVSAHEVACFAYCPEQFRLQYGLGVWNLVSHGCHLLLVGIGHGLTEFLRWAEDSLWLVGPWSYSTPCRRWPLGKGYLIYISKFLCFLRHH